METQKDYENNKNNIRKQKLKGVPLNQLFDRFPSDYSRAFTWQNMMKLKAYPNWDGNLYAKLRNIQLYIKVIENKINMKYGKMLGSTFSISKYTAFYADQNMPYIFTKMTLVQLGKNQQTHIKLNIPLDRLIEMPPMEIYALLSASAISVAQAIKNNKFGKDIDIKLAADSDGKDKLRYVTAKIADRTEKIDDYVRNKKIAHTLLTDYFIEFLPRACGGEFKNFYNISSLVADEILEDLGPKDIEKLISSNFDISLFNDKALKEVGIFTGKDVTELRTDKLYQKAEDLWKDPNKEPEALNISKQFQALMSVRLKDDFAEIAKNADNPQAAVDIKKFCQNYVDTYMDSNGLKSIPVTFENSGELGTYIDAVSSQRININLSKIDSISELIITLSHELKHAVESAINKSQGKTTEEGFGLDENMSFDISETSLPVAGKEYSLLQTLNFYSYRLNPHERTARFGEISGLKFMEAMAKNDKMKEQLATSIQRFKDYQSRTLEIIKELSDPKKIEALKVRVDEVIKNPSIPEKDKQMIKERFEYIKEMMSKTKAEKSLEEKSLEEIEKLIGKKLSDQKDLDKLEQFQQMSM